MVQMCVDPGLYELKKELDALITPEMIESAEKLHRRLSRVSHEDMFRPFSL